MPVPFILGALAALGVGTGLGTMGRKIAEKQQTDSFIRDAVLKTALEGGDVPADMAAKVIGKENVPALVLLSRSAQMMRQRGIENAQRLLGSGGGGTPPSTPAESPMMTMAPWAQPQGGQPDAVPIQQPAVQPRLGVSTSVDLGGGSKATLTQPPTSEADAARVSAEQARLGLETERAGRERALAPGVQSLQSQSIEKGKQELAKGKQTAATEERKQTAQGEVRTLLEQAAALPTTDLKGKLSLFEKALGPATISGDASTLSAQIDNMRNKITGKALDLANPNEAEYIATTGKNPYTDEPVTPAIKRQADAFIKQQTVRKENQARVVAQTLAGIQTAELPKRVAISGSIKSLVKEGDNVAKAKVAADQINDALKVIKDNLDVFPSVAVVGPMAARAAEFFQTERGQRIKQVVQALTILQGREPRALAGEQGRIANQIEQQWRGVQPDPRSVTRKTAEGLLRSSQDRVSALVRANSEIVTKNAKAARGVGVPDQIVKSFTEGDLDVLKSVMGEGLQSGAIPAVIGLDDLGEGKPVGR